MVASEEEVVVISTNNGETTILGHLIKEEVDTMSDLLTMEEEEATSPTRRGQISIATTVESSDTELQIVDLNNMQI